MAGVPVFKIHPEGVRALLKSPGVQADLLRRAQAIAGRANSEAGLADGFVVDVDMGPNRARAAVVTATAEAMVAEATQRTLTRSVDAARG